MEAPVLSLPSLSRASLRHASTLACARPRLGLAALTAIFFLGAAIPCRAAAAGVRLQASEEVRRLLAPYLPDADDKSGLSRERLRELAAGVLATEGYFSPEFNFSGSDETIEMTVSSGPRTTIAAVDIVIDGAISPGERQALIAGWTLPVGAPFRQADWSAAKEALLSRLLAVEHAAASLVDSEAEIDAEAKSARLRLHYDAGPRYRFGELRVVGLERYDAALIDRYAREVAGLEAGSPYREEAARALQSRLQASPYFASVQVALDTENARKVDDGGDSTLTAPLVVRLSERPRQRISFGVGVSTNTGARVSVTDDAIGFFNQPWQLSSGIRLEQKRQTAYADLFLPPDAQGRVNSAGVLVENSDIEDLKTERYALGVQTVSVWGRVERRLALNWQSERSTPLGGEETRARALFPSATWTWRSVDDVINPRRGIVAEGQIGGASKALASDQNFLRLHGRYQHYLPVGERDTLTVRGEIGATLAPSRDGIPQDYLFRAGGAGSVRGYAYQSLGVSEARATVGGRYLYVMSGEYTHWFSERWGAAFFVDAGDAVDELKKLPLAVGYGVGIRFRSPAGPIGADLAYGVRDRSVQLHFALTIPF